MKEATGELNMTVITIVAIAAIVALFYAFVWPAIQGSLNLNTCKNVCPNGEAVSYTKDSNGNGGTCKCSNTCSMKVDKNGNLTSQGSGC